MTGVVLKFLQTFICAYLFMVAILFFMQRELLYMPPKIDGNIIPDMLSGMKLGTVTTADGLDVKHWFAPPRDQGKPVGVLFYGNAAYMASRTNEARALLDLGYGVLLVSYRGYDGNPGKPTEQGLYNDARANIDWLKAQNYDFFLMGQSLGSGVAVQMATEYPAKALILETPYTSMIDAASYHYPYVPVRWLLKDRFDSLSKITQVKAPVFIIQGEADEVIPVVQGKLLFERANEPKEALWLPSARHNDYYMHGGWPQIVAFLGKHAGPVQ